MQTFIPKTTSVASRILGDISFVASGIAALLGPRVGRGALIVSLCPAILGVGLGMLARRKGGRHIAGVHDIQSGPAGSLGLVGSSWVRRLSRWWQGFRLDRVGLVAGLAEKGRQP